MSYQGQQQQQQPTTHSTYMQWSDRVSKLQAATNMTDATSGSNGSNYGFVRKAFVKTGSNTAADTSDNNNDDGALASDFYDQGEMGEEDEEFAASMDVAIAPDNKGYKLLQMMGWKGNTGLGANEDGRLEPVRVDIKSARFGLGKQAEYDEVTDASLFKRRALDTEIEFTEEEMQKREEKHRREEAIKRDVKEMNKAFYCEICDKQYKNVHEMTNHLASYDHHHRKRYLELKQRQKKQMMDQKDGEDKRKKEQLKQEKELKKMQAQAAKAMAEAEAAKNKKQEEDAASSATTGSSSSSSTAASGSTTSTAAGLAPNRPVMKFGLSKPTTATTTTTTTAAAAASSSAAAATRNKPISFSMKSSGGLAARPASTAAARPATILQARPPTSSAVSSKQPNVFGDDDEES